MTRPSHAVVATAALVLAAVPFVAVLANPPRCVSLAERMAMVRADLLENPCASDSDCWRRLASYGISPTYYEGPDEWLESGCLAKRDATACAYLAAWRQIEPEER